MADWDLQPTWASIETINNGKRITFNDGFIAEDQNKIVENIQYLYNNIIGTEPVVGIGTVTTKTVPYGTPSSVEVTSELVDDKTVLNFAFNIAEGPKGDNPLTCVKIYDAPRTPYKGTSYDVPIDHFIGDYDFSKGPLQLPIYIKYQDVAYIAQCEVDVGSTENTYSVTVGDSLNRLTGSYGGIQCILTNSLGYGDFEYGYVVPGLAQFDEITVLYTGTAKNDMLPGNLYTCVVDKVTPTNKQIRLANFSQSIGVLEGVRGYSGAISIVFNSVYRFIESVKMYILNIEWCAARTNGEAKQVFMNGGYALITSTIALEVTTQTGNKINVKPFDVLKVQLNGGWGEDNIAPNKFSCTFFDDSIIGSLQGNSIESIDPISHSVIGNETVTKLQVNIENTEPQEIEVRAQNGQNGGTKFIDITEVPSSASSGTLTEEQMAILNEAPWENYIRFYGEKFIPMDVQDNKGYRVYIHHEETTNKIETTKFLSLALSTKEWTIHVNKNKNYQYYCRINLVAGYIFMVLSFNEKTEIGLNNILSILSEPIPCTGAVNTGPSTTSLVFSAVKYGIIGNRPALKLTTMEMKSFSSIPNVTTNISEISSIVVTERK